MDEIQLSKSGDKTLDFDVAFLGPYKKDAFSMSKFQIYYGGRASLKTSRHTARVAIDCLLIPKTISFVIAKSSEKLGTGIVSEFTKVIDRISHGTLKEGRGKDYQLIKRPYEIRFSNGSQIHFLGSSNITDLKGRSLPSPQHRFGHVLLDEAADYSDLPGALELLVPTFTRNDSKQVFNHYLWEESDLDLDRLKLDENGEAVTRTNEYGKEVPVTIAGKHTTGAIFLLAWNPPINKYDVSFDLIEEYKLRPDSFVKKMNYTDVENELVAVGLYGVIAEAETLKAINPQKYAHQYLGEPVGTEGLFFKTFKPQLSKVEPRYDSLRGCKFAVGFDSGFSNNTALVYSAIDKVGNFVTIDTYTHSNRDEQEYNQKGADEYTKELMLMLKRNRKLTGETKPTPVFLDPSAKAQRLAINKYLKENPKDRKLCKVYKATNDRKLTLETMQDYIITNRFYYYPKGDYVELENEIARAKTNRHGDDIEKENDHLIDAVRYVLYKLHRLNRKERY